jgi:ABC-type cobalamin transport system ATPase subunit
MLLRKGKVLAGGPREKILTSEQLSSLFEVSARLFREDGYFHLHA